MKIGILAGAMALGLAMMPGAAFADDPNDPAMRNAEARARDAAMVRQLNREQAEYVRQRDAQNRAGWQAYREQPQAQADYDRQMAQWREAVRRCNAGQHRYCAR